MTHSFSTTEEIRLSALRYAEQQVQSEYVSRQGIQISAPYTAEQLIESAKKIEAYLTELSED